MSLFAPWLDGTETGSSSPRAGRVIASGAGNAMKFGPLIGDRLAQSALTVDHTLIAVVGHLTGGGSSPLSRLPVRVWGVHCILPL